MPWHFSLSFDSSLSIFFVFSPRSLAGAETDSHGELALAITEGIFRDESFVAFFF